MPIYEYRCRECGTVFEVMQRLSDPLVEVCQSCPGKVDKLVSQTAFQLKGTGWYVTDYARKGPGNGKGKSEDQGTAPPAKVEGASPAAQAQPATKPDSQPASTPASAPSSGSGSS